MTFMKQELIFRNDLVNNPRPNDKKYSMQSFPKLPTRCQNSSNSAPPPPPPLQVAIWWLGNGSMDYIYQNANFLLAVLNEKEKPKFSRVGELNPSTQ